MGSLVARWLARSSPCHLWLLGRSGRAGGDAPLTPGELEGPGLVTLARSDVSSAEEAAFVARAVERDTQQLLEVRGLGAHLPCRLSHCCHWCLWHCHLMPAMRQCCAAPLIV